MDVQELNAIARSIVADHKGIEFVYRICSYLPLLGLLTVFLPDMKQARRLAAKT